MLTDIEAQSELQAEELRESLEYVLRNSSEEVAWLGRDAQRVALGGMSIGMPTVV